MKGPEKYDWLKKRPVKKEAAPVKPRVSHRGETYWDFCDNCGHRLESLKCEYRCPRCGFFRSCSEP